MKKVAWITDNTYSIWYNLFIITKLYYKNIW